MDVLLANILQYGLHLFWRRGFLGDVELEGVTTRLRLGRVIACLIDSGTSLSTSGDLLHEVCDACRRGGGGLVEDGDGVEAFALERGNGVSLIRGLQGAYCIILTKRNILAT